MDNILFFTNTDYFTPDDLQTAKNKGFKIFQININYQELVRRNAKRVKDEDYEDANVWLKDMLVYQKDIKDKGLVDEVIDGNKPISEIINQLKKSF
jgi:ribosomal protein L14E/L6E/L27E